tara:strand:- start:833 stop:1324 length:492 start_codon:yes stop_codon:yes gene_type:complete
MNKILFTVFFFVVNIFAETDNHSRKNILGDTTTDILFKQYPIFKSKYKSYEVNTMYDLSIIRDMDFVIMFGTWCHDSKREVPRMLRILDSAGVRTEQISLIGVDTNKEEPKGQEKTYNLRNTPTLILLKNGEEVGRIIERPNVSLEADLINLMTRSLEPVVGD